MNFFAILVLQLAGSYSFTGIMVTTRATMVMLRASEKPHFLGFKSAVIECKSSKLLEILLQVTKPL